MPQNYLDVIMENLRNSQEKDGVSFVEATAINAMVKAAWNEIRITKLADALERKGLLSQDEREGIDQGVVYAMRQISKVAEAKYPLLSHAIDSETER